MVFAATNSQPMVSRSVKLKRRNSNTRQVNNPGPNRVSVSQTKSQSLSGFKTSQSLSGLKSQGISGLKSQSLSLRGLKSSSTQSLSLSLSPNRPSLTLGNRYLGKIRQAENVEALPSNNSELQLQANDQYDNTVNTVTVTNSNNIPSVLSIISNDHYEMSQSNDYEMTNDTNYDSQENQPRNSAALYLPKMHSPPMGPVQRAHLNNDSNNPSEKRRERIKNLAEKSMTLSPSTMIMSQPLQQRQQWQSNSLDQLQESDDNLGQSLQLSKISNPDPGSRLGPLTKQRQNFQRTPWRYSKLNKSWSGPRNQRIGVGVGGHIIHTNTDSNTNSRKMQQQPWNNVNNIKTLSLSGASSNVPTVPSDSQWGDPNRVISKQTLTSNDNHDDHNEQYLTPQDASESHDPLRPTAAHLLLEKNLGASHDKEFHAKYKQKQLEMIQNQIEINKQNTNTQTVSLLLQLGQNKIQSQNQNLNQGQSQTERDTTQDSIIDLSEDTTVTGTNLRAGSEPGLAHLVKDESDNNPEVPKSDDQDDTIKQNQEQDSNTQSQTSNFHWHLSHDYDDILHYGRLKTLAVRDKIKSNLISNNNSSDQPQDSIETINTISVIKKDLKDPAFSEYNDVFEETISKTETAASNNNNIASNTNFNPSQSSDITQSTTWRRIMHQNSLMKNEFQSEKSKKNADDDWSNYQQQVQQNLTQTRSELTDLEKYEKARQEAEDLIRQAEDEAIKRRRQQEDDERALRRFNQEEERKKQQFTNQPQAEVRSMSMSNLPQLQNTVTDPGIVQIEVQPAQPQQPQTQPQSQQPRVLKLTRRRTEGSVLESINSMNQNQDHSEQQQQDLVRSSASSPIALMRKIRRGGMQLPTTQQQKKISDRKYEMFDETQNLNQSQSQQVTRKFKTMGALQVQRNSAHDYSPVQQSMPMSQQVKKAKSSPLQKHRNTAYDYEPRLKRPEPIKVLTQSQTESVTFNFSPETAQQLSESQQSQQQQPQDQPSQPGPEPQSPSRQSDKYKFSASFLAKRISELDSFKQEYEIHYQNSDDEEEVAESHSDVQIDKSESESELEVAQEEKLENQESNQQTQIEQPPAPNRKSELDHGSLTRESNTNTNSKFQFSSQFLAKRISELESYTQDFEDTQNMLRQSKADIKHIRKTKGSDIGFDNYAQPSIPSPSVVHRESDRNTNSNFNPLFTSPQQPQYQQSNVNFKLQQANSQSDSNGPQFIEYENSSTSSSQETQESDKTLDQKSQNSEAEAEGAEAKTLKFPSDNVNVNDKFDAYDSESTSRSSDEDENDLRKTESSNIDNVRQKSPLQNPNDMSTNTNKLIKTSKKSQSESTLNLNEIGDVCKDLSILTRTLRHRKRVLDRDLSHDEKMLTKFETSIVGIGLGSLKQHVLPNNYTEISEKNSIAIGDTSNIKGYQYNPLSYFNHNGVFAGTKHAFFGTIKRDSGIHSSTNSLRRLSSGSSIYISDTQTRNSRYTGNNLESDIRYCSDVVTDSMLFRYCNHKYTQYRLIYQLLYKVIIRPMLWLSVISTIALVLLLLIGWNTTAASSLTSQQPSISASESNDSSSSSISTLRGLGFKVWITRDTTPMTNILEGSIIGPIWQYFSPEQLSDQKLSNRFISLIDFELDIKALKNGVTAFPGLSLTWILDSLKSDLFTWHSLRQYRYLIFNEFLYNRVIKGSMRCIEDIGRRILDEVKEIKQTVLTRAGEWWEVMNKAMEYYYVLLLGREED